MAFAVPASVTETAFPSATTDHLADLPSTVNAGDRLLLLFSSHGGFDVAFTDPEGWTPLYDQHQGDGPGDTFIRAGGWWIIADGTEGGGTVNVVTNQAEAGSAQVYRFTGAGSIEVSAISVTPSNATSFNMPAFTPSWGAKDTVWMPVLHAGDDDVATTGVPTNYGNLVDTACGGGANSSGRVASARRELNAASENPGTWTIASAESAVYLTIAIEPSASGGNSGTLAETLEAMTADGAGTLPIDGTLQETLAALALDSVGTIGNSAVLDTVLAQLLLESTDSSAIEGVLAKTLEGATLESDAVLPIAGTLIETLAQLSLEAAGVPSIEAVADNTLEALVLAAQAELPLTGTTNVTLGELLLAAQGAVGSLEGTLDVQLALLTLRAGNKETLFWRNLWISVWEDLNG